MRYKIEYLITPRQSNSNNIQNVKNSRLKNADDKSKNNKIHKAMD